MHVLVLFIVRLTYVNICNFAPKKTYAMMCATSFRCVYLFYAHSGTIEVYEVNHKYRHFRVIDIKSDSCSKKYLERSHI
jgi:hypothetical protein